MKTHTLTFIASWVILALFTHTLTAQSHNEIKERMKQRRPALEHMWQSGIIGENAKGYVEARGTLAPDQTRTINAENNDRKKVYSSIAQSTKSTPEKVGQQRAAQIAKRAAKGLWLQSAQGNWYKK